jgi:hypothetical protein
MNKVNESIYECIYTTQGNLVCQERYKTDPSIEKSTKLKSKYVNFPAYTPDNDLIGVNTRFHPIDQEEKIPHVDDFKFL